MLQFLFFVVGFVKVASAALSHLHNKLGSSKRYSHHDPFAPLVLLSSIS